MARGHSPDVSTPPAVEGLWEHHHAEHRDAHQVVSQWKQASDVAPSLLEHRVRGAWWEILDDLGITLIVTREYEHIAIAMCNLGGRRRISHLSLPHPNGMAVDPARGMVHIASTRNPNVVFDFAPCASLLAGGRSRGPNDMAGLLLPVRARYPPGTLYIHDLARIGGQLHANAVGMNAVVRLPDGGGFE
jgi:hypothetical protein